MIFKFFLRMLLIISFSNHVLAQQYYMSRAELESYLSRAISMQVLANENKPANDDFLVFPVYDTEDDDGTLFLKYQDDLRMIANLRPKFIGRAAFNDWSVWDDYFHFNRAIKTATDVHAIDPDIILQAGFFEFVDSYLKPGGSIQIQIPDWVFIEFGEPVPATPKYFDALQMAYDDYPSNHLWDYGNGIYHVVLDISKLETRKWFYYRARKYIDAGYEAIHMGWISIQDENDTNCIHRWDLCSRIRNYAANNARRHFVLLDAHGWGLHLNNDGNTLLFDFHSMPVRMKQVSASFFAYIPNANGNYNAIIESGFRDAIYGNSMGGTTYMGWSCSSLPFLVEFDNYDVSDHPGTADPDDWYIWGWDEISWFANESENYRKEWLRYAYHQVRCLDGNGYLEMPGLRGLVVDTKDNDHDPYPWPTYHANMASSVLPNIDNNGDGRPDFNSESGHNAYNLEETIKALWDSGIPSGNTYPDALHGQDININNLILTFNDEFVAKNDITSNAVVTGNEKFIAGNKIDLLQGFEARAGSNFEAFIDKSIIYCDNPPLSAKTSQSGEDVPPPTKKFNLPKNKEFKIYPNPASSSIMVEIPSLPENQTATFSIYNLLGELILSDVFTDKQSTKEINTTLLPGGVYVYRYNSDALKEKGKLVIVK